jgi:hypothetical protein
VRALAAALVAAALAACTPGARAPSARPTPAGLAPGYGAMAVVLRQAEALAARRDAAGLRALHGEIVETGLGLLRARMPHDLRDADVPRFHEGRLAFGDALKDWAVAVEGRDDAALFPALERLADAYFGWMDAYKGRAPERSV